MVTGFAWAGAEAFAGVSCGAVLIDIRVAVKNQVAGRHLPWGEPGKAGIVAERRRVMQPQVGVVRNRDVEVSYTAAITSAPFWPPKPKLVERP